MRLFRLKNTGILRSFNENFLGISIFFIAILSVMIMSLAIRDHVGISHDSVKYLNVAQQMSLGKGVSISIDGTDKPFDVAPPFLSFFICAMRYLGFSPKPAMRLYVQLFFVLNTLALYFISWRVLRNRSRAFLFTLFIIFYKPFLSLMVYFLSEPLYFFLSCVSIGLLAKYCESDTPGLKTLIGASIVITLSYLSRYIGLVLIAVGAIAILCNRRFNIQHRFLHTLIFLFFPLAAILIFPVPPYSAEIYGTANVFSNLYLFAINSPLCILINLFTVEIGLVSKIPHIIIIIFKWLLLVAVITILAIGILKFKTLISAVKKFLKYNSNPAQKIVFAYCLMYFLIGIGTILTGKIAVSNVNRYILIIEPMILLLLISGTVKIFSGSPAFKKIAPIVVLILFSIQIFKTSRYIKYSDIDHTFLLHHQAGIGQDYNSRIWDSDCVLNFLKKERKSVIFSNDIWFAFYELNRPIYRFDPALAGNFSIKVQSDTYILLVKHTRQDIEAMEPLLAQKRIAPLIESDHIILYRVNTDKLT